MSNYEHFISQFADNQPPAKPMTNLNVLLDKIEKRANTAIEWPPEAPDCDCPLCVSVCDVPALVKALRRAEATFTIIARVSNTNREHSWAQDALRDITAILQASSEPKGEQP